MIVGKGNKIAPSLYHNRHAVSEIIGAMMLLLIVISAVSTLYLQVLSSEESIDQPTVTILGKIEAGNIIIEHVKGQPLSLDTKVSLTLGGYVYIHDIARNMLDLQSSNGDQYWNIGERLIYSGGVDPVIKVESSVVDVDSNSLVLWGVLQEGLLIKNMGGLWHLNESEGIYAYDSSGNDNTGVVMGALWRNSSGISRGCLEFDGFDDFVVVSNSFSLGFTDGLTLEVWLRPVEEQFEVDDKTLSDRFCFDPMIIHTTDAVFAVVGEGEQRGRCNLSSFRIISMGVIEDVTGGLNTSLFVASDAPPKGLEAKICHISDGLCVVSYTTKDSNVAVFSCLISDKGHVVKEKIGQIKFISAYADEDSNLKEITDQVFMVVSGGNQGVIHTISLDDVGVLVNVSENNSLMFESSSCLEPNVTKVSDSVYAVVYGGKQFGIVKTVRIFNDGQIDDVIDTEVFCFTECHNPELLKVSDNIFALVYEQGKSGFIKTLNISDDGFIHGMVDSFQIDDSRSDCVGPDFICVKDNVFGVAFCDKKKGVFSTFFISSEGMINESVLFSYDFEQKKCYEPNVVRVSGNIFAVVYRNDANPHDGVLKTIKLIEHRFDSGVNKGVFKEGCFGVFANQETVFASINDQVISASIANPLGWNHVVLTYDSGLLSDQMKLYVNGDVEMTWDYSERIVVNRFPVIFGKEFFGFLDEIALYDRALSGEDVSWNYNNPEAARHGFD